MYSFWNKTRKINKLLHNNNSHKVVFNDICKVLSDILCSNILVISRKGKVLGVGLCPGVDEIEELIEDQVGGFVDPCLTTSFKHPFYKGKRQSGDSGLCRGICEKVPGYHHPD